MHNMKVFKGFCGKNKQQSQRSDFKYLVYQSYYLFQFACVLSRNSFFGNILSGEWKIKV